MRVGHVVLHKVQNTAFRKINRQSNDVISQPDFQTVNIDGSTIFPKNIVLPVYSPQITKTEISKDDFVSILESAIKEDKKRKTPIIKSVNPQFVSQFAKKVYENPNKNIIIGLSGESASGKSTICETIREVADEQNTAIEVISADNYFKDISGLIKQYGSFDGVIESGYDVDSPENFYIEQLHDDLEQLANGNDVKIPQYLVNGTGISVPNAIPKKAQKVIIVEGLATLYSPVRDILDAEIFVDIDPKTQEERYVKRAKATRNQTEEDALNQLKYVRLAAEKYIHPKKDSVDITVDGSVEKEHYRKLLGNLLCAFKK